MRTPTNMSFKKYQLRSETEDGVSADLAMPVDDMKLLDNLPLTELMKLPPLQQGFRDGKYIHVSDLINKCPRAIAIHYVHDRQLYGMKMGHQLGFTFKQGEALASYMEDHVRRVAPEHMYGGWACNCGKTSRENTTYDTVADLTCKTCGSSLDNYKELFVSDDEYMISGSIDITLLFGDLFYVDEIKSIKKDGQDGFTSLTQAKPIHRIQALFYTWLLARSGYRVHTDFSVFYISKSFGFRMTDQIKEYKIRYTDYASTINPYLEDAKAIKIAREGGPLPKRVCEDVYVQEAKNCELCPLCFNLDS